MARQLVESLLAVEKFDIDEFHDTYREELLDLIERKAAGEKIVTQPTAEPPAKVLDLVGCASKTSLAKGERRQVERRCGCGDRRGRRGCGRSQAEAAPQGRRELSSPRAS